MRKLIIALNLWLLGSLALLAQQPAWVAAHPTDDNAYIGIGFAALKEPDYIQKATQNALNDIALQIATRIESNSFMHTVDIDGKSRELFEDKIKSSVVSYLEGQKLMDSYQDDRNYYVYYSLDKAAYEQCIQKHKRTAINTGLDYYNKAQQALDANSLVTAVQLLGKGLDAVSPWLFMDLSTTVDGNRFDVPAELYNAYIQVFDGLTITTNQLNIEGEAFKPIKTPIAGCLSKNGAVVQNVKLKAEFVVGSGQITPPVATDYNGTSEFYVTNITSKASVQEIHISIDDSFIADLPVSYRQLIKNQSWPSAKITITLALQQVTAYLNVSNSDLSSCEKQITAILANQHFTMTEDPDNATLFIDLSTSLELGGVVAGDLYDLNECLCGLVLKIYDNQSTTLLLNYVVDRLRVLAPVNKSPEQTEMMCVRELMKRVKRELPKQIKNLVLN